VSSMDRKPGRLVLIPARTARQGQQINIGKENPDYQAIVQTLTVNAADLARLGIADGARIRVRSPHGQEIFRCQAGDIPEGLAFVPYGPPANRLIGASTGGTGMPESKGIEIELEPLEGEDAR